MNNYTLVKNTEWKEVEINGDDIEIPNEWNFNKIGDLVQKIKGAIKTGPFGSDLKNSDIKSSGIKVYMQGNVIANDFSSGINYISFEKFENKLKSCEIFPNDILITARGTVGKFALVPQDAERGILHSSLIKLKLDLNVLNNDFALFIFNKSLIFKNYLNKILANTTIPALYAGNISSCEIYYPNMVQQQAIASILSAQESLIQDIESLISKYESRFQYLSEELLSGRLRVKEVDGKTILYKNADDNWKEVEVNGEMKEIPMGWCVDTISNVTKCLDNRRKPLNQSERSSKKGAIPYWGANSIVDHVNDYLIDEEVILLGEDAAPFYDKTKKVAFISKGKIWPNNHIHVLKSLINSYYLMTILNYVQYEKIIGTESRPKLTQMMMNNIEFAKPDMNEQYLISTFFIMQENLINQEKNLLVKEKQKFDWLLDNLLSGKYSIKEN